MLNLIAELPPGGKAKMTVMRKNREATLDVTVGKRPRQTSPIRISSGLTHAPARPDAIPHRTQATTTTAPGSS
jgi:hypothetical protein